MISKFISKYFRKFKWNQRKQFKFKFNSYHFEFSDNIIMISKFILENLNGIKESNSSLNSN